MNIEFYNTKKRKKLISQLNEQFGIVEIPRILFETGKEKIRAFSGTLNREEIQTLGTITNIEIIGLYICKQEMGGIRLSFDGSMLLGTEAKENTIELNAEQAHEWLNGKDLPIQEKKGMYLIKYGHDILGCGAGDNTIVHNFVPKERRIRFSRQSTGSSTLHH